ncbi:hypothetical protein GGR21_000025 [Dysgonomonas hofstadii]|uniref:Uncharacterized protein n=1 Tax=Dysgonomonas hofstadii TaxID=637886 RepID=A0A840CDX6_9BACT|nr:hypothetical protein [Dysgonomonas hofstadii]MBB4034140.1 hypothetical protein [Dysgonomonas hofstadii]
MKEKIVVHSSEESLVIIPKESNIINLRKKAIDSISNLLDVENIAQIIYIDDKFDIESQKEEYKARLIKLKHEKKYLKSEEFDDLDWDAPTPKFETDIAKLWEKSEDKSALLLEICSHDKNDEDANVIPALEIERYFGNRIKLMTPDEWVADKHNSIVALEKDQRVICLFDFEFQNGSPLVCRSNGALLAKNILDKKRLADKVVCGIFSHKFTEEQEDEYRELYCSQYKIKKDLFYTISKFRFAFDPQIIGFLEGIKNLLLLKYVELLKVESLKLLSKSNKRATTKIQNISPKTFNQIIQKSSVKEGVWEVNTLFRLYGILSKVENFNMISDKEIRKKFNESIRRIRGIDIVDTGYTSNIKNQQLIDLRTSELYISGSILNKLHLPLANGDIFEIKGKEYMLLVQPCNLALRSTGSRSNEYDNAFLLPIKLFKKEELNHTKHEVHTPSNASGKILCAHFSDFKILSLNFLDLTVFNEEGRSIIDMKNPQLVNDVIHTPWKKRYHEIQKSLVVLENTINSFKYVENNIILQVSQIDAELKVLAEALKSPAKKEEALRNMQPLREKRKHLIDHLKTIESSVYSIDNFETFKISNLESYDIANRIFSFDIKRVKHYKSPYSDDLLQKFMLYLSRNAFEHDFTS